MARLYKESGYSGIVITDHLFKGLQPYLKSSSWKETVERYCLGYDAARAEGRRIGLTVLWAMELTLYGDTTYGDYLVYGLDPDFLQAHPELYALDLAAFREIAGEEEMLVYQAHPFRQGKQLAPAQLLDGIEVYNGNPRQESNNGTARDFAEKHGLRFLASSDAHRPEDVARAGMLLPERAETIEALVRLLREDKKIEPVIRGVEMGRDIDTDREQPGRQRRKNP
jgi:predicted metal-dependent phosphoesterase TrpH